MTRHRGGISHPWPVSPCPVVIGGEGVRIVVGAAVVYEAIGKNTVQDSLDSLRTMGVCAAYGHVSSPPDRVDIIQDLGRRGSQFITRPAIMYYVEKRSDLEQTAWDLFKAIGD